MSPPTSDAGRDQILMLLGELREAVSGIKEDISELHDDRKEANESRRRIYEKLEDGNRKITELESTVRVTAGIAEKLTNRVAALEPQVKQANDTIKTWTIRGGLIATAVAAFGGFVYWMIQSNGPAIWSALMHLLTVQGTVK